MDIEAMSKHLREVAGYQYVGKPNNVQTRDALKYQTEQLLESYRQELGFSEPFKAKLKIEQVEGMLTFTETIGEARARIRREVKRISDSHLKDKPFTKVNVQIAMDEVGRYLYQETCYYKMMYGIELDKLFLGALEDED
ncbi:hypothetical protein CPT_Moonbeam156 [Bacillus phage Moonbeam]|uniref:Uncharacterized protein n=1 Tax=Bacillus phage Moonbeam TaxID=1540091 RepID=A0A0A0RPL6_9CAUD|nr:hypothetical protein CPT_Moonbeam156 [Bacillus phage Moonbeam]AIW03554.1 hypothetical protein CPT_Moonbeam156 [Bacillus phage Moonbeam]